MLSKIKNMKGGMGFLAGILVMMLLIPSVAVAAGLKFTGIEGTSGNKADVTPNQELITTSGNPGQLFQEGNVAVNPGATLWSPATNKALIVQNVSINTSNVTSSASNFVSIFVNSKTCPPTGSFSYFWIDEVNPSANGVSNLPFAPGLPVPQGDYLCAAIAGSTIDVAVSVSGEVVPASEVNDNWLS